MFTTRTSIPKKVIYHLFLAMAILLIGCGNNGNEESSEAVLLVDSEIVPVENSPLDGTAWLVQTVTRNDNEYTISGDDFIELTFSEGYSQGETSCGPYEGNYEIDEEAGLLTITRLSQGIAECSGETADAHGAFLGGLQNAESYQATDTLLTITTPTGSLQLIPK